VYIVKGSILGELHGMMYDFLFLFLSSNTFLFL
jgi:hypothetical protein